jgi:hypothetical protein
MLNSKGNDIRKRAYIRESVGRLEIIAFHPEHFPIIQIALHDFPDRLGQTHTQQSVGNLGQAVNLAKLEKATSDLRRILCSAVKPSSAAVPYCA